MSKILRLRSRRAPYLRGAIRFDSVRTPVELTVSDALSADQVKSLSGDPQISGRLVEVADDGSETVVGTLDKDTVWPPKKAAKAPQPPPPAKADKAAAPTETGTDSQPGGGGDSVPGPGDDSQPGGEPAAAEPGAQNAAGDAVKDPEA